MRQLHTAGSALAAALLTTGLAIAPSSPAFAATAPSVSDFVLRSASLPAPPLQDRVDQLDARLAKLGVQNLLTQANRTGAWATGSDSACPVQNIFTDATAGPKTVPPGRRFCWNASDASTESGNPEWFPQGVTTVADAQADELWGTKQAVLVSWYDKNSDSSAPVKGVRVSFIDTATNQYQHVLLAYPYINSAGQPTYEAVTSPQSGDHGSLHAGGIAWYGNYLYVADTVQGFRVFDMRYILDLKSSANADVTDESRMGLRTDGKYTSFGYRYVMPQVDYLVSDLGDADPSTAKLCASSGTPKFSFVSLDRTGGPHLITGEYCPNKETSDTGAVTQAGPDQYGRVATWPLDSGTGQLVRSSDGKIHATAAYRLPAPFVQGASSYGGKWYLSRTGGGTTGMASLLEAAPGGGVLTTTKTRWAGIGAEDLSIWPGRSEVWTVTEHAGKRVVYACPLAATADDTACNARS
jgi:hypothetical protein